MLSYYCLDLNIIYLTIHLSWHSLKVVLEEERRDKETNPELEKRMLNLQHDIAILEVEIMQSKMKRESEMAILEAEIM